VRELENVIRRALILCGTSDIGPEHLSPEVRGATVSTSTPVDVDLEDFQTAKARTVESFERSYLTNVLRKSGGIVSRASERSGLSERNFHEKLKRYSINARAYRASA
jgi:two-component system response regulator GlrR